MPHAPKPTAAAVKVTALSDLKVVKKAIAAQAKQRALQISTQAKAVKQAATDKDLFVKAAGAVKPLPDKRKVLHKTVRTVPLTMQYQKDEKAVLKEAISDEFDVSTLLEVDEHLSFRRPGIGPDVTRKLRRGDWSIQRQLDLHGLRRDAAREALSLFIREAHQQGIRCVRVVHGKGLGSPGKAPVLKSRVHSWLVQKNEVLAFVQAKPADGGAGALVVLLMTSRA
ncbi:Smr/MutS family protein [Rhodoferax sp.]|uniref:Smr/MutS family protein n=1 Tax=Rhodoferax sp. TaxID=50421 RepID=UPI002609CF52|nr:Smr/MutS family protein [Rhodoferax sp.]MDD4944049.1 Smr/MutS family protein [Rhodoferax sp.]MDD5480008.1 Smr/MutS family protein [Rhodoferax sp.]